MEVSVYISKEDEALEARQAGLYLFHRKVHLHSNDLSKGISNDTLSEGKGKQLPLSPL